MFDSFAQGDSITDTSRDLQTQPNRQTHMVHVSMVLRHMGLPSMFPASVSITFESVSAVDGQLIYERFQKMGSPQFHGVKGEDAYEFLTLCHEISEVVGLVDPRDIRFVSLEIEPPLESGGELT